MLICASVAAVAVAVLIAVRTAQAQAAGPVRIGDGTPDRLVHRSGTLGPGDDSWDSNGHGYRNC